MPVLVVLSKVDLLTQEDRERLLDYTRNQLAHQLGMQIQVAPLSTRPELDALLEEWIENEIAPRAADAQRLSRDSIHRKTRSLAQRVFHALEISAKANTISAAEGSDKELAKAEAQLRTAASLIEGTRTKMLPSTQTEFEMLLRLQSVGTRKRRLSSGEKSRNISAR